MDDSLANLQTTVSFSAILGYFNFSEGKPDSRFEKQINDGYALLAQGAAVPRSGAEKRPWERLHEALSQKLAALHKEGGAFQDVHQVEAVLALIFDHLLPAYRKHHQDLLAHLSDADLFQSFFLARVAEAVLAQGPPWNDKERIIAGALNQLNDYVGYRPIAILENRPKGEPYPHERVRPIPLYIRGAGTAWGRYRPLVECAITILQAVTPGISAEASFDLDLLDELALDPRAYDQSHPAGRPRNYIFGEWDPYHLDDQGRFRRFVVRGIVLEALLDWVRPQASSSSTSSSEQRGEEELLFEAAAVLAGTILMASGICGSSPTAHDSTVTLSKLIPRIARCREAFYANVLEIAQSLDGSGHAHAERLRQEAKRLKQPLGGVRQHLNEYLAKHRAGQLQHRHVAMLYAEMGYFQASREEAKKIPAASTRFLTELWIRLTACQPEVRNPKSENRNPKQIQSTKSQIPRQMEQEVGASALGFGSDFQSRVSQLAEMEDLIHRGIDCGALPDPWNILGFQGMFPLSAAQEDSIRDPRIDDLTHLMENVFDLYSLLMSDAASAGERSVVQSLSAGMKRLAAWWDQFASVEILGVRRVHGAEAVISAEHVAESMARWREKGEATGDLVFWKQHLEGFRTPKAFALVLDALLHKEDYRAAMALLMTWLNQVEQVPLEEGPYSFHTSALGWVIGATRPQPADWLLVQKFFDYLEANAEEYWDVPEWETSVGTAKAKEDSPFAAAYEGVTYQDTTDDDTEESVADGGGPLPEFDFEPEANRVGKRLGFLSTMGHLWQVTAWRSSRIDRHEVWEQMLAQWLDTVLNHQRKLRVLLDSIHNHPIPQPMGSYESMVEYDRRRALKEHMLHAGVATGLDLHLAAVAIRGVLGDDREHNKASDPLGPSSPAWEPLMHRLVQALLHGDREKAREVLPSFVQTFQKEPLLIPALSEGGQPKQILRVRIAQTMLRTLLANLPRLGLLRETFDLLQTARTMERSNAPEGLALTEFNHLFQAAFEGVVTTLVDSSEGWPGMVTDLPLEFSINENFPASSQPQSQTPEPIEGADARLVEILEALAGPFFRLWVAHSQTVRLSVIEKLRPEEWDAVRTFIQRYGRDLFHVKFMTLANLRGILRGGIQAFLDFLRENPDPMHPIQLIENIDAQGMRPGGLDVNYLLECILEILVGYYDEYKEYNSSSPQSDYGDKLYVLLDFLRIKAAHDRHVWQLRPLYWGHEILVAKGHWGAALLWQQRGELLTRSLFAKDREELERLEKTHGLRLASISERVREKFETLMEVDRFCALVEPAMEYEDRSEAARYFDQLRRQVDSLTAHPSGSGMEVPNWLSRLEQEVQRVEAFHLEDAHVSEDFLETAQIRLSLEDVRQEIEKWPQAPEVS